MLKKSLILFICLLSSLSISYMYSKVDDQNLSASTNSYTAGGTVTGRVNKAPSNLQGSKTQIGMKKGDRYYLGVNHINGTSLGWQLIRDSSNIVAVAVDE